MYDLTPMFWYKGMFAAELICAEIVTMLRLKRRSYFPLRAVFAVVLCIGLAYAVPVVEYSVISSTLTFLVIFCFTIFAAAFCFKESMVSVVFCAIAGYTVQHIAYTVFDLSIVLMGVSGASTDVGSHSGLFNFMPLVTGSGQNFANGNPFIFALYAFIFGMTYWLSFHFVDPKLRGKDSISLKSKAMFVLVVIILCFDTIFSSVITYYSNSDRNDVYLTMLYLYNIFCCLLSMYLQFSVALRTKLENDLNAVNRLWKQQKQQYELSKENINLINMKCHDLKHQIRTIVGNRGKVNGEAVREIEELISIYDSEVKTENEALDVILTEKSLYCNSRHIKFSCIADGSKLNFISETDIYSLFGNLIDNAVEAVAELEEDKKIIGLNVREKDGFVSVNIHNFYAKQPEFDGKLPRTTKTDREMHGYGMKSVQMLCEKYGGEMTISAKHNVFNVNIVFPR